MFKTTRTNLTYDERQQQIYDILRGAGLPLTMRQITARAGLSRNSGTMVKRHLNELAHGGDVVMFESWQGRPLPTYYYIHIDHDEGSDDFEQQLERAANLIHFGPYEFIGPSLLSNREVLPF